MNRQLYDLGGAVDQARDFYTNNLGMNPQEANAVLSDAMASLNQQTQPQSMMQMASNGGRIGYQMGGITSMPMNFGQPLQVPQQTSMPMQPMMSSPMANYGQTPLMMRGGGIARLGYQEGGEAMMQPQMGGEMSMPQMNEQQALETIIQLLIEQGIDPETALQLAAQILQIFAQGGEPAVEAFADQLEQQEQAEAMASGGIAGYGYRQGYGFGGIGKIFKGAAKAVSGVVKGVAKAVKSVAKSPIGRIALTIGANMLLPGAGTAFGAALQSAAVNLGLQAIGGGKINPLEALAAGASGYFGYTPSANAATTGATATVDGVNATTKLLEQQGLGNPNIIAPDSALKGLVAESGPGFLPQTIRVQDAFPSLTGQVSPTATLATATTQAPTGILQTAQNKIGEFFTSPLDTVKKLGTSALDYAKEEPGTALAIAGGVGLAGGLGLGSLAGPKRDDETDDEYAQRLQKASPYLRQYYANLNPGATPSQIEQFVTANTGEYRAGGGIIGYATGGTARLGYRGAGMVSPRSNPTQQDELNQAALDVFKRPLHQLTPEEVDMLIEFIKEKFGKAPMQEDTTFAARGGSMIPPARQIEGGIIELDARKTGGYIPYGKKERVDDVPAMLAKDEFVFTSRAVKAAGGGSAKQGAAKMYKLMKQLEAKGRKMERGARA